MNLVVNTLSLAGKYYTKDSNQEQAEAVRSWQQHGELPWQVRDNSISQEGKYDRNDEQDDYHDDPVLLLDQQGA